MHCHPKRPGWARRTFALTAVAVCVIAGGGLATGTAVAETPDPSASVVPVGSSPADAAFSPDGAIAYVTNSGSNSVSVISAASGKVTSTIPVGKSPQGVAFTPDGTTAYVTNSGGDSVSVIDVVSGAVSATIPVGSKPYRVAFTPNGKIAFVVDLNYSTVSNHPPNGSVTEINVANRTVVKTIPVGLDPTGLAVSPDGATVYVTNGTLSGNISDMQFGSVSVIDAATGTVTGTIPVGHGPFGVALTPDGTAAWVTNLIDNSISVISTSSRKVTSTLAAGGGPIAVKFSSDGATAYVANNLDDTVSVVATATGRITAVIPVGTRPAVVALSPDGTRAYVPNTSDGTVSRLWFGAVASMVLMSGARSVEAGGFVTFHADGLDGQGAELGEVSPLFTSSVASDAIAGNTVVVTRVGSRTITANYRCITATASIVVRPWTSQVVLVTSPGPQIYGLSTVRLTATIYVGGVNPEGGVVSFQRGSQVFARVAVPKGSPAAQLGPMPTAVFRVPAGLGIGRSTFTAVFTPATTATTATTGSTSNPVVVTVVAPSKVALRANNPLQVGGVSSVVLTAAVSVSDRSPAAGWVAFKRGTQVFANVTVVKGQATFAVPAALGIGKSVFTAVFTSSRAGVNPSTSNSVTITVQSKA